MNHLRKVRNRKRQEGAALLIVLFVLLMATTTAVYSLSSTQYEVRAAGSMHQSMRAKFVSEGAASGSIAFCMFAGTIGCTDNQILLTAADAPLRQTYALPNAGGSDTVYMLDGTVLGSALKSKLLPDDTTLSGVDTAGGGTASAWTADFTTVMEKWEIKDTGGSTQQTPNRPYRLVLSTYGSLSLPDSDGDGLPDDVKQSSELRYAHTTISATRAYIDTRN